MLYESQKVDYCMAILVWEENHHVFFSLDLSNRKKHILKES